MSFLESGGQRHALPVGDLTIGSDPSAGIVLAGANIAPRHAVVRAQPDGQTTVRKADASLVLLVNDVPLGPNPTPLLHGDKVTVGGHEFRFVDERQSGSTQYVAAVDPSMLAAAVAAKASAGRAPTAGTGGRLVSLTDGREYVIAGGAVVIGRDATCDVVLTERSVSRRHTEIMATPKGYLLIDTSTNGTLVNGTRVEKQHVLARGDVIQCGDHEFRFYADVAPAAPPPVPAAPAPSPVQAPAPPVMEAPPAPPPAAPPKPSPEPHRAAPPPPPPAPPARQAPVPPPAAAPGAAQRLSNTMHGMPAMSRPGSQPAAPPPPPPAPPPPAPPPLAAPKAAPKPGGPPPGTPLAYLIGRSGEWKGKRFPIKVPIVNVGRAEYNDVVITDGSVSTMHAKLQRREGIWVLMDLESTNGTMVDGERVEGEMPLAPGAFIRFGDVSLVFEPTDDTVDAPKGSSTSVLNAGEIAKMLRERGGEGSSGT